METTERKDIESSALHRRGRTDGRRSISLTKSERSELQQQRKIIKAVEMFLDINVSHSWEDIAKEISVTVRTLKNIVKTEEFIKAYNEYYDELTSDPRRRASIITLNNMLPKAIRELENLINGTDIPPTVRLNAVKEIMRLNNVGADTGKKSDRNELAEFLKGIGVMNVNIGTTPDHTHFDNKIKEHGYEHAVDGEFEEIED